MRKQEGMKLSSISATLPQRFLWAPRCDAQENHAGTCCSFHWLDAAPLHPAKPSRNSHLSLCHCEQMPRAAAQALFNPFCSGMSLLADTSVTLTAAAVPQHQSHRKVFAGPFSPLLPQLAGTGPAPSFSQWQEKAGEPHWSQSGCSRLSWALGQISKHLQL